MAQRQRRGLLIPWFRVRIPAGSLNAGKLEQAGTPWEIYYRPRTNFIADFVGAVNLVPAKVAELRDGHAVLAVGGERVPVRVPDGLSVSAASDARLCIRPEALWLAAAGADLSGTGSVPLPGTVKRKAFLGDLMRYWIDVAGRERIVDQPDPGAGTAFEGPVTVVLRPERAHLITG